jgi:hypothetical protein
MNVNRFDVEGWIDDTFLGAEDLRAGRYDDARFTVAFINPASPADGAIVLPGGAFGEVTMETPTKYRVEVSSLFNRYQQQTGELYGPRCPAQYGDARCKLTRLSFTGSVDTILNDRRKFTATATGDPFPPNDLLDVPTWAPKHNYYAGQSAKPPSPTGFSYEAITSGLSGKTAPNFATNEFDTTADFQVLWMAVKDDYFKYGRLLWLTGLNAGFGGEIKTYNGTDSFELFLPVSFEINAADTFRVEAGDDKRYVTCLYKFDNLVNFRGFEPFVRGERTYVDAPDSTRIK